MTWRAAVQEQTNEGADEARYKKGRMKLKLRDRDAGQGRAAVMMRAEVQGGDVL